MGCLSKPMLYVILTSVLPKIDVKIHKQHWFWYKKKSMLM